jgi:hypothetical protein
MYLDLAQPVETEDDSFRYNSRYKLIWSLHICKDSNQKTSTLDFSKDQNLAEDDFRNWIRK